MKRSTWHVKSIDSSSVTRPRTTEMLLSRDTKSGVSASSHRLSLPFALAPLTPALPSDFIIRCSISPSVRRRLITSFRCYKHSMHCRHQQPFTGQGISYHRYIFLRLSRIMFKLVGIPNFYIFIPHTLPLKAQSFSG